YGEWEKKNESMLDALRAEVTAASGANIAKSQTQQKTSEYLGSPEHAWYSDWGQVPPLSGGAALGYLLGRSLGPRAWRGIGPGERARVALPYAGEMGAEGILEEYARHKSEDPNVTPHGQDINRFFSNLGIGAIPGTAAGSLYRIFAQDAPPAEASAAAMQKLK